LNTRPVALLLDLRRRGVEVVAVGDRIRFRPQGAVTAEDRATLAKYRTEVIAEVKRFASARRTRELASLVRVRGRLIDHAERSGSATAPGLRAEYGTLYQDMRREWFTSCAVACHAYKLARCILIEAGMTKPCDGELLCPRCVQARSARSVPPKPTVEDLIVMASEAMYGPARAS